MLYSEEEGMDLEEKKKESSSSSEVVDGEKFVPRVVLRILLVESDDSTRRIVAALLRKCSYKVAAVSDGLKAWETIKARSHSIDLILTEFELPSISGYALLTLIMEHDFCKNIPVIMMSSQDSIGLVLKCMLRGAADFLIKPVRRNELKNLWQHVWRRQTQKSGDVFQKTTAAKHKASCEKKERSEKGSNDQSSSTMSYLEAASAHVPNMQGMLPMSCRSASHINDEEGQEESVKLVVKSIIPKSETGGKQSRSRPEVVSCVEAYKSTESIVEEDPACARIMTMMDAGECPQGDRENDNILGEIHSRTDELVKPSSAIDLISKFENYMSDISGCFSACGVEKFSVAPCLELSLRNSYPSSLKDIEQQTLKHSNASAFSRRYDNSKILQPLFPTMGSRYGHDTELSSSPENLTAISLSGRIEAATPVSQFGFIPLAGLSLNTSWNNYIPPIYNTQPGFSPVWEPKSAGRCEQSSIPASSLLHSNSEIHNSEQGCHRDETANSADPYVQEEGKNMGPAEGLRDGSPVPDLSSTSSLYNGVAGKLNSSVSGSICSTIDSNSNPFAAVVKSTVSESVNQNHPVVRDGLIGMDSHCPTQREAALLKFRLKRKDRCFDKKIRYQSRKRLAEQRPRVKGQFVRQVQTGPSHADC